MISDVVLDDGIDGAAACKLSTAKPPVRPVARAAEQDPGTGLAPARGRVLIVEDEYFLALENEAALRAAGYEVAGIAASAADAVKLASETRPEIVLMDIRLNGARDGIDAAIEISDRFGIAIVFATALTDRETRARAERSFALGWLPKPYSSNDMLDAVSRAMQILRSSRN